MYKWVFFLLLCVFKIKKNHKPVWTKLPNTCAPHRPQSQCHRIPYALPHSPSTLPFFLFLFPSSLTLYMAAAGGALLFVPVAGKGRSGLHLSFASCYHFSHLCPPPSLPLLLFTPPHLCLPPFLPLTYSNRSGVEWSEERRGRNSRTTLNSWPFNSVNFQLQAAY